MDGVGSTTLTKKQVKKIIENAQEALGAVDVIEPVRMPRPDDGMPIKKLTRAELAALGKNPKNTGAPQDPDFGVPLPTVERQG